MLEHFTLAYSLLLALLIAVALFFLAQIVYPRLSWLLTKWQYRNPDSVEPSRTVFELRRVKATVLFIVFTVLAVILVNARDTFFDLG